MANPGGSIRITRTAEHERTITASVGAAFGGKFSARAILAKVEATYNVTLARTGTRTSRKSVQIEQSLGESKEDRYFAGWQGRRVWRGTWTQETCVGNGSGYEPSGQGSLKSFQVPLQGVALCPASRYAKGSLPYKACVGAWPEIR
ncbi:MAG: hypothetical protein ACT4PP_11825 [Sporichthyaceae bacterium]